MGINKIKFVQFSYEIDWWELCYLVPTPHFRFNAVNIMLGACVCVSILVFHWN